MWSLNTELVLVSYQKQSYLFCSLRCVISFLWKDNWIADLENHHVLGNLKRVFSVIVNSRKSPSRLGGTASKWSIKYRIIPLPYDLPYIDFPVGNASNILGRSGYNWFIKNHLSWPSLTVRGYTISIEEISGLVVISSNMIISPTIVYC